jgi:hypothetical protein
MTEASSAAIEAMVSMTKGQTAAGGSLVTLTMTPPAAVEASVTPDFDQQLLAKPWSL